MKNEMWWDGCFSRGSELSTQATARLKSERKLAFHDFDGVATDADVRNLFTLLVGANEDMARAFDLGALLDVDGLTRLCDPVTDHPRGRTAGSRACGRVFSSRREHAARAQAHLGFLCFAGHVIEIGHDRLSIEISANFLEIRPERLQRAEVL